MSRKPLPKTICILFSGKAGTGKTYWANNMLDMLLLSNSGYVCTKGSFASSVKEVAKFIGWDGNKDGKGRTLLQDVGAVGRKYDENVWVKGLFENLEDSVEYPFDVVIVDDCRFKNEIEYIKSSEPLYKVVCIRLNAPTREILLSSDHRNDQSEVDLDDYEFDYTIDNDIDRDNDEIHRQLKVILEYEGIDI